MQSHTYGLLLPKESAHPCRRANATERAVISRQLMQASVQSHHTEDLDTADTSCPSRTSSEHFADTLVLPALTDCRWWFESLLVHSGVSSATRRKATGADQKKILNISLIKVVPVQGIERYRRSCMLTQTAFLNFC